MPWRTARVACAFCARSRGAASSRYPSAARPQSPATLRPSTTHDCCPAATGTTCPRSPGSSSPVVGELEKRRREIKITFSFSRIVKGSCFYSFAAILIFLKYYCSARNKLHLAILTEKERKLNFLLLIKLISSYIFLLYLGNQVIFKISKLDRVIVVDGVFSDQPFQLLD